MLLTFTGSIPQQNCGFVRCVGPHVCTAVTLGAVQNQLTHRTIVDSDWYDKLCAAKQHNSPQLRVQWELLPGGGG